MKYKRYKEYNTEEFCSNLLQKINALKPGEIFVWEIDMDGSFINGKINRTPDLDGTANDPVNQTQFNFLNKVKELVKQKGAILQVNICSTASICTMDTFDDGHKDPKITDKMNIIISSLCALNDGKPVVQNHVHGIYIFRPDRPAELITQKNPESSYPFVHKDSAQPRLLKNESILFNAGIMAKALYLKNHHHLEEDVQSIFLEIICNPNCQDAHTITTDPTNILRNVCFMDNDFRYFKQLTGKLQDNILQCPVLSTLVDKAHNIVNYTHNDLIAFKQLLFDILCDEEGEQLRMKPYNECYKALEPSKYALHPDDYREFLERPDILLNFLFPRYIAPEREIIQDNNQFYANTEHLDLSEILKHLEQDQRQTFEKNSEKKASWSDTVEQGKEAASSISKQ